MTWEWQDLWEYVVEGAYFSLEENLDGLASSSRSED